MKEEIKGDFDLAVRVLIEALKRAETSSSSGLAIFAKNTLLTWDWHRGNDWYTSPKKHGEISN